MTAAKYYIGPYGGLDDCCICDAPTTHVIPTERQELLPYCSDCAIAVKREFPDVKVFLYGEIGGE